MKVYNHHVVCNAMSDIPHGGPGCVCHVCGECHELFVGLWKEHTCMSMFILGPSGPVQIPETEYPVCPECGGKQSNVTSSHKMSCGFNGTLCPKCHQWRRTGREHECPPPAPPTSTALFEIPPRPRDNRWRIEWRWKPKFLKSLAGMETGENPWTVRTSEAELRTECTARNLVARLRKMFPGKSYRYRGYHVTR